jgi:hypothetical protein
MTQPVPYSLQASSELSRDFYLTDEVKIQSGDQVLPFVNPNNGNAVEALVFSGGTLSHLRRDPAQATGWTYAAFDLQGVFNTVSNVALAANGSDVYALLFGDPAETGNPAWLTRLTGPATWDAGLGISYEELDLDPATSLGTVAGGISREGTCYFYSSWVDGTTTTLGGWIATGATDPDDALDYQQFLQLDTSTETVDDLVILYDTNTSNPASPTGFAVVLMNDGNLNVYPQDGEIFDTVPMVDSGAVNVTELMWAWASPASSTGIPGYAYQQSGATVFADENGNVNTVSDQALAATNAVTVWQKDGLYTVNLLDRDGTLQMIQELSNSGTGSWAPPLPLVPDLGAVFGVPTDPNEATLFAVGLDESLNVLSLGPAGWVQTQVHQAGEEQYDFAAYHVQAIVLDANGTPVAGAQVAIGTQDLPVGCWTPEGAFYVTPDTPAAVTADVKGEITFSVPAQELDCATLVVQAHDPDGNPTGSPFTVTPDTDVRGFLGGTGTLTDQGSLTPATLLGATSSGSTTPLFTGLTSLPADQQQQAATASTQALGQLVKVGQDASSGTVTAAAFTLNLSSGAPTYSPTGSSAQPEGEELHLSWGSFGHLFDSIGHALRHAAMTLKTAVIKLAEDGKTWLVDLVVQIGDDLWSAANLVITDMKHAFHVIGGFFNALGADIKSAVQWLWHDIVAFLKDVKTTADQLQTWITQLGGEVTSALQQIKLDTDNWFSAKEQQAHDAISYMKNEAEGTLGGPPLPPPTNDTGSTSSQNKLLTDLGEIAKVMNDAPGKWLLDKFLSYLPVTDPGPVIDQSTYQPLLEQLAKDWVDGMTFSQALFSFVGTTMSDGFSSGGAADKSTLTDTQLTTWFTDLDNTVVDGLQLLDDVADTALDIAITGVALAEDYFTYQYNVVGSMGLIGFILEEAGVDFGFSLTEIISWVVAFPAALVGECLGYSSLFPPAEPASALGRLRASLGNDPGRFPATLLRKIPGPRATLPWAGPAAAAPGGPRASLGKDPDGWQVGLGIIGAAAQGVWGMADLVGDAQQLVDPDTGKRGTPSGVIDYFDILCPLVETVALWPSEPNTDGSASYPFHGGLATSTSDWELLPFVIWTAVIPSVFGAVAKAGWTSDLSNSGFPSGVQDVAKDYLAPFIQMISGTANTVLGSVYSAKNDAGAVAITGTVLGNLSYVGAPLATKIMNETTDDVSTLVKLVIDAVGNIGAAVCIAEATSLPTP